MESNNRDASIIAAIRESASVTTEGQSLSLHIDGVRAISKVNHVDHRGRVFEIYSGESDFWTDPIVYCYAFTVRPGQTKGWGLHEKKADRYTLISGEVLTILFDARIDSPTHGLVQKVYLTPEGIRQLRIPTGVWHMNICLGVVESFLINHPTEMYEHSAPDRLLLPWDSNQIPVDIREYFPVQYKS